MVGGMEPQGEAMVAVCESKLKRATALLEAVPSWVRSHTLGIEWLKERTAERGALAAEFQKIKEGSSDDVALYNSMYTEFQRKFQGDFGTGEGEVISNKIELLVGNLELLSSALERASRCKNSTTKFLVEVNSAVVLARSCFSEAIWFLQNNDPVKKDAITILSDCFRVPSTYGESEYFFSKQALVRSFLWMPQFVSCRSSIQLETHIATIKSCHEALSKACEDYDSTRRDSCVIQ